MTKSANQLYRESGSDLPFKTWLKMQQQGGEMEVHEFSGVTAGKVKILGVDARVLGGVLLVIAAGTIAYRLTR